MKLVRLITGFILSLLLAISFVGCTKEDTPATSVAATVNGTDILEDDVTARIEAFRIDPATGEVYDDATWAQTLVSASYTPETLREFVIRNQFAIYTLILQKAAEANIIPDTAKVDQALAETRTQIEDSGASWEENLKSMGYANEAAYRQELEARDVYEGLIASQVPEFTPTQAQIEQYVSENAAPYAGKRVSVIYLPFDAPAASTDETADAATADSTTTDTGTATEANTADVVRPKAEEALAKLREGTDFAEVAKEYSQLQTVLEDGGDLGWGSEASLPVDARIALDSLPINEVSDVIETNLGSEDAPSYAFLIVKWTDEFVMSDASDTADASDTGETPDATDASDTAEDQAEPPAESSTILSQATTVDFSTVPSGLVDMLTETYIQQEDQTAQNAYVTGLVESDEIVINPMPEGLPYAVDMALADTAEESSDEDVPAPQPDESGLEKADLVMGTGTEAKTGDTVTVHYTGYLSDGTTFDSSVGGTPYEVVIGQSSVIQGWHLGLVGMKVGGKRQLIIPPDLAYGADGTPDGTIPPNATLTFDIELVSVNGDSTGYTGESITPLDEGSSGAESAGDTGAESTSQ